MKIMHIETGRHLYGGARQVLFIMQGLAEKGVSNILVCEQNAEIKEAASDISTIEAVKMKGDLDIAFIGRVRKLIKKHQPDIVHIHSRRGADWFGGLAAKMEKVPAIVSRRVDNPESRLSTRLKYGLFDKVITISQGIADVLRSQGLPSMKLAVVPSSVDTSLYKGPFDRDAFRTEFNLDSHTITVGVIAQLIDRKGHKYLLQCLPALCKKHPNLRVLFFGKGPLSEEIQQKISELGLQNQVQLTGFRADLPQWIGCLDIVAHPADMEGLGVSLLQAAAASVAMIASRAGGIPEIVNSETGLLIEPGDAAALESGIDRLISDQALRHQLGNAALEHVEKYFSIDSMIAGNVAVYNSILQSP